MERTEEFLKREKERKEIISLANLVNYTPKIPSLFKEKQIMGETESKWFEGRFERAKGQQTKTELVERNLQGYDYRLNNYLKGLKVAVDGYLQQNPLFVLQLHDFNY